MNRQFNNSQASESKIRKNAQEIFSKKIYGEEAKKNLKNKAKETCCSKTSILITSHSSFEEILEKHNEAKLSFSTLYKSKNSRGQNIIKHKETMQVAETSTHTKKQSTSSDNTYHISIQY